MLNPHVAAVLAAERRDCACGAVAEPTQTLCRKCRARAAWRRKVMRANRRGGRRMAARGARSFTLLLAETMPRTRAIKGGQS
jgi:hypothetical protein